MSSFTEAYHLLDVGRFDAALAAYEAIAPHSPQEAFRRFLFIGVCQQGRRDQPAAFVAFEAGRAIAVAERDDHAVVMLDGAAASTLIALQQHTLLTARLTTNLTQRLPFLAEADSAFYAHDCYFWLWENARSAGDEGAAHFYHAIATALSERDMPPEVRPLFEEIMRRFRVVDGDTHP